MRQIDGLVKAMSSRENQEVSFEAALHDKQIKNQPSTQYEEIKTTEAQDLAIERALKEAMENKRRGLNG